MICYLLALSDYLQRDRSPFTKTRITIEMLRFILSPRTAIALMYGCHTYSRARQHTQLSIKLTLNVGQMWHRMSFLGQIWDRHLC
jgi:hypothetical protein